MVCTEEKIREKIRKRQDGGLVNPPFRLMDKGRKTDGKMVFNPERS